VVIYLANQNINYSHKQEIIAFAFNVTEHVFCVKT